MPSKIEWICNNDPEIGAIVNHVKVGVVYIVPLLRVHAPRSLRLYYRVWWGRVEGGGIQGCSDATDTGWTTIYTGDWTTVLRCTRICAGQGRTRVITHTVQQHMCTYTYRTDIAIYTYTYARTQSHSIIMINWSCLIAAALRILRVPPNLFHCCITSRTHARTHT